MKKCLVIGGAGFVGTNLSRNLAGKGYDVTICDHVEGTMLSSRIRDHRYIKLNYFRQQIEDDLLRQQDMVILLISSVNPDSSMANPEICYDKDIIKMIELLEQMRRCEVNRLVFVSSGGTVYGNQNVEKLREDMLTYPINHYGIMKLTQEKILLMYNHLYGMDNVIFRLANPYGDGQRKASGVGAVTAFLQNIMNGEKIYLYGQGEPVRDYIHIDDAVEMMRLCLEKRSAGSKEALYNVGTGEGNSILEVMRMAERIAGRKADVVYLGTREFDVARNVLDIGRICSVIGGYKCLNLEMGMRRYYESLRRTM